MKSHLLALCQKQAAACSASSGRGQYIYRYNKLAPAAYTGEDYAAGIKNLKVKGPTQPHTQI